MMASCSDSPRAARAIPSKSASSRLNLRGRFSIPKLSITRKKTLPRPLEDAPSVGECLIPLDCLNVSSYNEFCAVISRKSIRTQGARYRIAKWWPVSWPVLMLWSSAPMVGQLQTEPLGKTRYVLAQIHAEVQEMGPYPGEDFIRREFFVGEDDDDTNKDVHVAVLIFFSPTEETMTVRVTQTIKDPGNPRARLAGSSKIFSCLITQKRAEIRSSEIEEKELSKLAPEILTAIRNKKRLLKLSPCGSGPPG